MSSKSPKPSFSSGRRWLIWFNTILGLIAVFAIVAMANYFASGYFKRFQASTYSAVEISPQTAALLAGFTNKVEVTIFFAQQENEEIYSLTSALLKQYAYANPNLTVQTLDYTRAPGKAAALLSKYKLTTLKDKNFVVFDCNGRPKVVYGNQLYDYDLNSVLNSESKSFRRDSFKGEVLFSSAIFDVTNPKQTKAYFVYGHGEHDPESDSQSQGYTKFASILKDELSVEWEKISLFGTNDIPADCQLLIIAGPSKATFNTNELEKIETYLKQGRRFLVLLNNIFSGGDSGIEKVLAKWNVGVTNFKLEDAKFSLDGNDLIPAQVNGTHPILKSIVAEGMRIYLISPRTVFFKPSTNTQTADAPHVEKLAATSTNAAGLYKILNANGTPEAREQRGSFPVIVSVEHGSIKNVSTERGVTRILVLGDSQCFNNQNIDTEANHYFANAAINWLVDRPQMLLAGIGPRPIKEYKLMLTTDQSKKLRWILLAGMPGSVLLFGGLVWLRRRS
ncbi:MAG: Gldg family protein [Verrucomicrobiota bacterium]